MEGQKSTSFALRMHALISFNSLMTGMSSGGQLCSHGFWDDDSLILKNDAVMDCQFISLIPVFSNVD